MLRSGILEAVLGVLVCEDSGIWSAGGSAQLWRFLWCSICETLHYLYGPATGTKLDYSSWKSTSLSFYIGSFFDRVFKEDKFETKTWHLLLCVFWTRGAGCNWMYRLFFRLVQMSRMLMEVAQTRIRCASFDSSFLSLRFFMSDMSLAFSYSVDLSSFHFRLWWGTTMERQFLLCYALSCILAMVELMC